MQQVSYKDSGFDELSARLNRQGELPTDVLEIVRGVIDSVRTQGDEAVQAFTARFDDVDLPPAQWEISQEECKAAGRLVSPEFRRAARATLSNVKAFARLGRRKSWSRVVRPGVRLGEKFDPIGRVGVYVPGGTAPLASTVLMTVPFAKVAGVREVIVCTPPGAGGSVAPEVLYALYLTGAGRVFRVGGAQAIAAMGLGTPTIPAVDKIVGPGNAYVTAAKQLMVGRVAIDLLAGPSELLVLADSTARADWVAADLLAQAEHGSGHEEVVLLTTSKKLIQQVQAEVDRQVESLSRRNYIEKVLERGTWLVHVRSMEQAIEMANRFAPEHVQVHAANARKVAAAVTTAGAIYIGGYSPVPLGDFTAGPSHVLPTGGAGKSFSGLTVDQFQRKTSMVEYTQTALEREGPVVEEFGRVEGLDAHARSVTIRTGSTQGKRRQGRHE
ncbi:MAG: histidinol dehydrogenase [Verrucomicrobiota bacterium]|nr:histidinol dehydrogenase [Verrucomicrobiota bacterium]